MTQKTSLLFLIFATSCTTSTPFWQLDSIAARDKAFQSSRLVTQDPNCPLHIEFLATESGITGFAYLTKHHFIPSKERPHEIEFIYSVGDERFSEWLPLLEGGMGLRLPDSLTSTMIKTLQDGEKIDILLDGFMQRLEPYPFTKFFSKLEGK